MRKKQLLLSIILLVLLMVGSFCLLVKTDYFHIDYIKGKLITGDVVYLFDKFIMGTPKLNDDLAYGAQDAPLMIIAFLDVKSDSSKYFMDEIFPKLKQEFIDPGKVKIYFKQHLTAKQLKARDETFKYAQALACVKHLSQEQYFDFYFELFEAASFDELLDGVAEFEDCMQKEFESVVEDMLDVELLGMRGYSPRFYIGLNPRDSVIINGVPSYERFRMKLREYQILIGD